MAEKAYGMGIEKQPPGAAMLLRAYNGTRRVE
jgi:hypothetical protein